MRVVPSSLLAAPPKIRTVSPHQALRARSLRGKPCIEPFSSLLYHSIQDPSTWSLLQGSQKVSKNFLGRGAAGAAGNTANVVRRLPWRLASDEDEGCPDLTISTAPKSRMVSPHQALRARSLRGKPCIEPCSSPLLRSVQDPSARSLLQGSQKVSKNFLGRGAAGAAGKAANEVRRQPKRLAATSSG